MNFINDTLIAFFFLSNYCDSWQIFIFKICNSKALDRIYNRFENINQSFPYSRKIRSKIH